MSKVEIHIPTELSNDKYIDMLIVCIARCGYSPYYNEHDKVVCFTGDKEELTTKIKNDLHK